MNIFLAPRSNETSYKNFESTIVGGRPYSFVEPYLTDQEKTILSRHSVLRIWGNKASLRARWKKMKQGDYVLFYRDGGFYYSAKVLLTKESQALGQKLWPIDKKNGKPWPCLFFIENLQEINIPIKVVQELAGYKQSWNRVQGFMMLRSKAIPIIESRFGSIGKFIGQSNESFEQDEEVLDEEIDETYEMVDRNKLFRDASNFTYERDSHRISTTPQRVRIDNQAQKRRIARLENYACQLCGWSLTYTKESGRKAHRIDVDHIIDKANGGDENINNLWVLCPNCHAKKTIGVVKIDPLKKKITDNGIEVPLRHDNHLGWKD